MQTESVPHEADFRVRIALVDATAYPHWNWRLRGPILEAAGENFLSSAEQYVALRALTDWRQIEERDEFANWSLLASLREYPYHLDLRHYLPADRLIRILYRQRFVLPEHSVPAGELAQR